MDADAVVVGSGPNGLVAANLLADAGWDVLVLEAQPVFGGGVHSSREVHPDFVHDTFSSFHPLAVVSPPVQRLRLEEHGLAWSHAPAVVGTPYHSGGWALLHRDPADTAAGLDAAHPGDGDAWLRLFRTWERVGPELVDALLSPFPPVRAGPRALARLTASGASLLPDLAGSVAGLVRRRFGGVGAQMLVAGNAAHGDARVDAPGSGVYGLLLAMTGQSLGYPSPVGGASTLADALVRRLRAAGGRLESDTRVERVLLRDGRAWAVRTSGGQVVRARRAVLADVTAPALYGDLVPWVDLPRRTRFLMDRFFRWDPATVKVDWALRGPVPWADAPSASPGTVHLCESVEELAHHQRQLAAHAVPSRPYLLVGQMATTDPTRAPAGAESLWAYTHVPQRTDHDAGEGILGRWNAADVERMADRMQARIEEYAPGFGERVLARRVLGPRELQARDANLHNGALNGGTGALTQQLVLRPVPGLGGPRTPVPGLYLASMSAHPGGGVHGACGANAAYAALRSPLR